MIENVSDSSRSRPGQNSLRHKQTQGIALVIVLLSAMVLMVSMLAISATMAISSQRTTVDQSATLQAQYAAESGLAYAKTRTAEAFVLFPLISVPTNTLMSTLKVNIDDFCGTTSDNVNRATLNSPRRVCIATGGTAPQNRNYSVFTDYISSADVDVAIATATVNTSNRDLANIYLDGYDNFSATQKTSFWKDIFSGSISRSSVSVAAPATGVTASFTPSYGFIPDHVDAIPGGYRLFFRPATVTSTASLQAGSTVVSTRRLTAEPAVAMFSLDIARRCFCEYNYFANRRMLSTRTALVFGEGEQFNGKVHINASATDNGAPYFYASTSHGGARFRGGFSTGASGVLWSSTSPYKNSTTDELFGTDPTPVFNADKIVMPENAASQKRAVIGGDPENSATVTPLELATAYGSLTSPVVPGIYYGKGKQKGDEWGGGIYVQGNVSDLKLTTDPTTKQQVITITQIPGTAAPGTLLLPLTTVTTFTQNTNGTWNMTEKVGSASATTTAISKGSFNGLVYVDGQIGSDAAQAGGTANSAAGLGGEGTGDKTTSGRGTSTTATSDDETPDIAANIRLTVAARDDINIKRNMTYTNDPRADDPSTIADESTYNMLGIYSEQGNIKIDGVNDKPLKVDATLMAVGDDPNNKDSKYDVGKGFGTVEYNTRDRSSTGSNPKLELSGGLIEEQSQGVGNTGGKGYDRSFTYDARFADGQSPPFFPTQGQYSAACFEVSSNSLNTSLPLPNALRPCSRNTEDIWFVRGAS